MVRLARVVALAVAHHITQRGNTKRFILETDTDRSTYLDLLLQGVQRHGVELIGYCLMSNHVHLIAVPQTRDGLARSLKQAHGRFASYWNAVNHSSGHVWQGRFYSCPLDQSHLWEALRYVELNPVRAALVASPEEWPWSSAPAHSGCRPHDSWLSMDAWRHVWSHDSWRAFLAASQQESSRKAIRDSTYSGRPLGSADFTRALEKQEHRPLTRQKPGPKKRAQEGTQQPSFLFDPF